MIAIAVAVVFYSLIVIAGTWVIARRPVKTMAPDKVLSDVVNAQQEALAKSIAEQHKTLEAIADEAHDLSLATYLDGHTSPRDSGSHQGP